MVEANLVINDSRKSNEAHSVYRRLYADVVAIALDIVELINVHRIALVAYNVKQEWLFNTTRVWTRGAVDEVLDKLEVAGWDVDIVFGD